MTRICIHTHPNPPNKTNTANQNQQQQDLLHEVLAALRPDNCRVDILSSTFGRAGEMEMEMAAQQPPDAAGADAPPPPPPQQQELLGRPLEREPRFGVLFTRERLPPSLLASWAGTFLYAGVYGLGGKE